MVAITKGINTMEQIFRARTHLSVILAGEDFEDVYEETKNRGERIVFSGPNTNTNIIRVRKFDRIRIQILFATFDRI